MSGENVDQYKKFLGKRVHVRMDHAIVATGRLLGFGTNGEFEVLDEEDGSIHYCWPALNMLLEVNDK